MQSAAGSVPVKDAAVCPSHVLRVVPLSTVSFQWSQGSSLGFLGVPSEHGRLALSSRSSNSAEFSVCLGPMPLSSRSSPVCFPVDKLTLCCYLSSCLSCSQQPSPVRLSKKRGAGFKGSSRLLFPGVILTTHRSLCRLFCGFSS